LWARCVEPDSLEAEADPAPDRAESSGTGNVPPSLSDINDE